MTPCRAFSVLLLVSASANALADESWFEGRWISDLDASIELSTRGGSGTCIKNAPPASNGECTTVKDRMREMLAGAPDREWIVDSGFLEYLQDGYVQSRSVYSIRPIEQGRFELLIEEQGIQLYMIIQRTKTGFCSAYGGDYTQPQSEPHFADCYKRSDNRQRIDEKTQVMKIAVTRANELYVDGKRIDLAQFKTALEKLRAAHGSGILYIEEGNETMFDSEINRAISESWVPISISTEPDFSTVLLPNGTIGKRE